jgi:hypothetical protein
MVFHGSTHSLCLALEPLPRDERLAGVLISLYAAQQLFPQRWLATGRFLVVIRLHKRRKESEQDKQNRSAYDVLPSAQGNHASAGWV